MKPEEIKGKVTIRPKGCSVHFNVDKTAKIYNFREAKLNTHFGLFHMAMNFMRRRGFDVGLDPDIEKHYKSLSKDHRYGIKKGLEFCSDRNPTGFKIEFFQNVTQPENSNGGKFDFDKYKKFPYQIKLMLNNECIRLGQYLESKGITVNFEYPVLNAEKALLKHYKEAHWLAKMPNTLNELQSCLKEYDVKHNSTDRDGKQIICGQVKYFYNHKRQLICGKAYHNINNMWWVILNDTEYTNVSASNLFDFEPGVTTFKANYTIHQQLNRIKTELKKAEEVMDYERCIVLKKVLRSYTTEPLYVIYSKKNNCYWRSNNSGYCSEIANAGIYLKSQIDKNPAYYNNGVDTEARPTCNNLGLKN